MLTEVILKNPQRASLPALTLPLMGPSEFPITFIDGLNPVAAEVGSSDYAQDDGAFHPGSRVGTRNIVLTLELDPDYGLGHSPESLRRQLVSYLTPKYPVDLTFVLNGTEYRHISAIVESFEAPLFTRIPAAQISLVCHDPYFTGDPITHSKDGLQTNDYHTFHMLGDIRVGFEYSCLLVSSQSNIRFLGLEGGELIISHAFTASEYKTFNLVTVPRRRAIWVSSSAGSVNLLSEMEDINRWPLLRFSNSLGVWDSGANLFRNSSITYRPKYAGL